MLILVDGDYFGHGSFALVENGTVTWSRHYAEILVPSDNLFEELAAPEFLRRCAFDARQRHKWR